MSNFMQTIQFALSFLPSWVVILFLAVVGLVLVFFVLKLIKIILDAIPFV